MVTPSVRARAFIETSSADEVRILMRFEALGVIGDCLVTIHAGEVFEGWSFESLRRRGAGESEIELSVGDLQARVAGQIGKAGRAAVDCSLRGDADERAATFAMLRPKRTPLAVRLARGRR